jgi:nucleoside-diphosphate-sugar epimerase
MNVTVFGATGAIGSLTVNELLVNGHAVTAYARNASKVPALWGDRVRVVMGEMNRPGFSGGRVLPAAVAARRRFHGSTRARTRLG